MEKNKPISVAFEDIRNNPDFIEHSEYRFINDDLGMVISFQAMGYLTIVDTVTLEGLEIGTNYKLSGWQMVKAENAKLLIDGKEVTNDYEFTADKENMEVRIEFTLDGSTLGGKQLVTFEELQDMTNPEEP